MQNANNERYIFLLVDYKGYFSSKVISEYHLGGMDKDLLSGCFNRYGYKVTYLEFPDVDFRTDKFKGQYVLYTSSEDVGLEYKSYIEDICLGLELKGANLIPSFKYLRAHHNKVFMEILRDQMELNDVKNISSKYFGTYSDVIRRVEQFQGTKVLKKSTSAGSAQVFLAENSRQLKRTARKISRSFYFRDLRDIPRWLKFNFFVKRKYDFCSKHRSKFIVQNYVPHLEHDWKVLVYGDKYYVLKRANRKNDFRASGSGDFTFEKQLPRGLLDFVEQIFSNMDVPMLSVDVAYDGKQFYLFEFQAIYFGTITIQASDFYFVKESDSWKIKEGKSVVEKEYARSVVSYLEKRLCCECTL